MEEGLVAVCSGSLDTHLGQDCHVRVSPGCALHNQAECPPTDYSVNGAAHVVQCTAVCRQPEPELLSSVPRMLTR